MEEVPIKGFVVWSKRKTCFAVKANDPKSEFHQRSFEIASVSDGTKIKIDDNVTFLLANFMDRDRVGRALGPKLFATEVTIDKSIKKYIPPTCEICIAPAILVVTITDNNNGSTQSALTCLKHLERTKVELQKRISHEMRTLNVQEIFEGDS